MAVDKIEVRLRIIEALMPSITRLGYTKTDEVVLGVARQLEEYITRENVIKEAVKPTANPVAATVPKEKVVNYSGLK